MNQGDLFQERRARPPQIRVTLERGLQGKLVVDNFAGGGGASAGIEAALHRPVDIAINHDAAAIAMHKANHPHTKHYQEDIWAVDPREATRGRPVGLAWFSPDCTDFSRAKGAVPVRKDIRALAWVVLRWAKLPEPSKPDIIVLENVEEFKDWGPLIEVEPGKFIPDPTKRGLTFRIWLGKLRAQGYEIEFTSLVAADYGAPTIRRRLFLVARRDRAPIVWPEPTHGEGCSEDWRTAAEVIDWSLPCPSIFLSPKEARHYGVRRPLAEATLNRIAEGIRRYVLETGDPFIVRHGHYSTKTGAGLRPGCGAGTFRGQPLDLPLSTVCATNDKHLVVPHIVQNNGGMVGHDMRRPLGAITSKNQKALAATFLSKFYGTSTGSEMRKPMPTITGQGQHIAEVRAFLTKYYGGGESGAQGIAQDPRDPLHTIRGKACFGVVEVAGHDYQIVDVGMRMLTPGELYAAQGFPPDYVTAPEFKGKPLTKTDQIRLVGNSVSPPAADAVVSSQIRRAA
jgi:DNA (cytosine-5)-methyltransferase 1